MPKIPTIESLGQRPTQAQQKRIVTPSGDGGYSQSIENFGNSMFKIGQGIQDREDRMSYVKAKSKFTQDMIGIESEFEKDDDYKTFPGRYGERVRKAKEEAAAAIGNGDYRQQFELDADTDIFRGSDRMSQMAFEKERDVNLADLEGLITSNRESALRAGNDEAATKLIGASQEAIDFAVQNRYLSAQQAQGMKQKLAVDHVDARIDMMPVDQRIKVLSDNKSIASLLPADVRAAKLDQSKKEQHAEYLRNAGQAEATALASKYKTLGEAMAANNAKDPEVRSRIDSELRRTYSIREDQRQQERASLFNSVEQSLIQTKGDMSAIDPKVWASMEIDDQKKFHGLASDLAEGRFVPNDWKAISKLTEMAQTNPSAFAKEDLTQYIDKMDKGYREKFAAAQEKAKKQEADPEITQLYNMNTQIDNSLKVLLPAPKSGASVNEKTEYSKKYQSYERIVRDRINAQETIEKRKLNEKERESIIDGFLKETVITRKGFIWDSQKKLHITDVPADQIERITAQWRAAGEDPTSQDIIEAYEALRASGKAE